MSITFLLIIIVVAVVLLVVINLLTKNEPKGIDSAHFKNEWNDCIELSKEPKTRPMSIVQADKLLDSALKCLGFKGNSMGERLISGKSKLKHRDEVWYSHKLRNKIVHETAFEPSESEVKKALNGYYKTFKDLGVW